MWWQCNGASLCVAPQDCLTNESYSRCRHLMELNEVKMDNIIKFPVCHFCKKKPNEVFLLITGDDGIAICDECVELCQTIINIKLNEKKGN